MSSQFTRLSTKTCFDDELFITTGQGGQPSIFRLLCAGPTFRREASNAPTLLLLHGGGHTAETWSLLSKELKLHYNIIAPDLRGHGLSKTADDHNLSMATLIDDVTQILDHLCDKWMIAPYPRTGARTMWPIDTPPLFLVGHSLGGALAVKLEQSGRLRPDSLLGVVVVDVVEGTAIAALDHIQGILKQRSDSFSTTEKAVQWHLRCGLLHNVCSAVLSVPPQLVCGKGCTAPVYTWRTDLIASEIHWKGWFEDLSKQFLSIKAGKLLILSTNETLDTELIVAQMAGRFQLEMISNTGHNVHEDNPKHVSSLVSSFVQRHVRFRKLK